MASSVPARYNDYVFVNCPFDRQYNEMFNAVVFTVFDCGYYARCARELSDGSKFRLEGIFKLIHDCRIGIHDISRTELDPTYHLPRFNMPLELGAFLAAKKFGSRAQKRKTCLILDRELYRYQKFCSDINGQDPRAHGDSPERAVDEVRNFLSNLRRTIITPGSDEIFDHYLKFTAQLPRQAKAATLNFRKLIFPDYVKLIIGWLKVNTAP